MPFERRLALRARAGRARPTLLTVALIGTVLTLTGCTAGDSGSHGAPTPSASASAKPSPLRPVVPAAVTADTAKTETIRIADAIGSLIAQVGILNVDDHSQLVTAATGNYYGVLRTIALDPAIDPIVLTKSMVKKLETAGWVARKTADADGTHLVALSSDPTSAESWFVILGGDSSVAGESVISVRLASPDIP